MNSGLLTLILLAASATNDATDGLDELLAGLVPDQAQAELHFVERRESSLLSEPLEITGRLWRDRQGRLVRQTIEPRRETQILASGMVIIERPGQSPRNFSLRHTPELAVLQRALSALLGSDAEGLGEHFRTQLTESESGWTLELRPRDPALASRVTRLTLSGPDGDIDRLVLELDNGETVTTELSRSP